MLRTFTFAIVSGLIFAVLIATQSTPLTSHGDTSGPNSSGYTWVDSNSPDPATTFEWIDATGGTRLAISDEDDEWETVSLPFTFTFFDTDYTQVAVASNGFLSFDTTDTAGCNLNYNGTFTDELGSSIPHDDANCTDDGWGANPLIAVWFDDLVPLNCGDIYHDSSGTAPDRTFVVEFNSICHYDCASTCDANEAATFEVIFFEGSNSIKFQYLDTYFGENTPNISEENYGGTATTGINLDGTTGLQYSWADPILTDGLAVLFSTGCPEDEDCDGVQNGADLCPNTPLEEAVDTNGCSDSQLDDDGDGFSNAEDICPLDAEDFDGFEDTDGCPDPDNDLDGICDPGQSSDSCTGSDEGEMVFDPAGTLPAPTIDCRNIPEDFDGFKDSDGCPEPDNDNDGFPDTPDACPGTDAQTGADGMLGSPEDLNHNGISDGGEDPLTTDDSVLTFEDYDGVLDGDGCYDSPGDDYDGDSFGVLSSGLPIFHDEAEVFMGTVPANACAATATANDELEPDAWPVDADDNQLVNLLDVLPMKQHFNTTSPDPDYNPRFDLQNQDGMINLLDVLPYKAFFLTSCAP